MPRSRVHDLGRPEDKTRCEALLAFEEKLFVIYTQTVRDPFESQLERRSSRRAVAIVQRLRDELAALNRRIPRTKILVSDVSMIGSTYWGGGSYLDTTTSFD